jgi:SAM-dependent MidA family methyltransferase
VIDRARTSPDLAPAPATTKERWAESRAPLVVRIRNEILATGPITFARFMESALYDPSDGYYATRHDRPTREGDYLSAPEMHPIFGATLASQVEEGWARLGHPALFTLREEAAGSGALGLAILEALAAKVLAAVRYLPIEATPSRDDEVRARLAAAGHAIRLAPASDADSPITGVVIANELLDALPVHRVTVRDGEFRELHVGWRDGWFADVALAPSTPELEATLEQTGIRFVEGQVGEIGLAGQAWMRRLGERLDRGLAIVIDYGHPAPDLYDPVRRPGGLLRTYRRHHAGDDPYRFVGEQDLTAHVDWTTLERVAADAGLMVLGRTSQAEFLTGLGLGDVLMAWAARHGMGRTGYAAARAAVVRLLDPRALGGFGVLVLGRGIDPEPPLRGLTFRLRRDGS